jgi:hypothetical protein
MPPQYCDALRRIAPDQVKAFPLPAPLPIIPNHAVIVGGQVVPVDAYRDRTVDKAFDNAFFASVREEQLAFPR